MLQRTTSVRVLACAVGLLAIGAPPASAALIQMTASGTIGGVDDQFNILPAPLDGIMVGDPWSFSIVYDTTTPDTPDAEPNSRTFNGAIMSAALTIGTIDIVSLFDSISSNRMQLFNLLSGDTLDGEFRGAALGGDLDFLGLLRGELFDGTGKANIPTMLPDDFTTSDFNSGEFRLLFSNGGDFATIEGIATDFSIPAPAGSMVLISIGFALLASRRRPMS